MAGRFLPRYRRRRPGHLSLTAGRFLPQYRRRKPGHSFSHENPLIFQAGCATPSGLILPYRHAGRIENSIPHTITNVLRCARENRDRAVPTDLGGRERRSGTISFSSIGSPQELPSVSGFLVLCSSEPDSGRSGPPHVPPLGIFLAVFEANRMGNAGGSDLCAGSGRGGGVQTSSRALPRNLGDGLAHSPGVCGPCVGVFARGGKASLGTCIASGRQEHGTVDCRRGRGRLAFYPLLRCAG